jgi:hypothetical protein
MNKTILIIAAVLVTFASLPADAASHRRHQPQSVKVLPKNHHVITHRNRSYYVDQGRWFRRGNGGYVGIVAPIGAIVATLPGGYLSFGIGLNRYFYAAGTYYRHGPEGYAVVQKPNEAEAVLASSGSDKLVIYPAGQQSAEQTKQDRYECHSWAANDSGYDPSLPDSDPAYRSDYQRAMSACLEARNYVVK